MIKSSTNQQEQSSMFRRPTEQTISAVDTLKTTFLPNLSIDSATSNYCPLCGQHFSRQSLLSIHMQVSHDSAGVLFATQMNSATPKLEYPCLSCDDKFSSGHELDEHNRATHQSFLARCISCGLYGISSSPGSSLDGDEYKCMHCGSASSATMITVTGQQAYLGQQMHQFVPSGILTQSSLEQITEKLEEPPLKVPPLTVKLNKSKNLAGIVIKEEPLCVNDTYGASTSSSMYLQQHTMDPTEIAVPIASAVLTITPNNKARHKCPECPRTFKTPGTLAIHRKIHTGEADLTPKERPHTCTYCGKSFTQSNTLKQHIRIHTGEKPYRCGYCGRAFTVKDYLNKHITTHTGEKPFRCSYCEKTFSVKDYLTKHIRTHTGEKPYQCLYCDKRFTQRSALTVHATKLHAAHHQQQ